MVEYTHSEIWTQRVKAAELEDLPRVHGPIFIADTETQPDHLGRATTICRKVTTTSTYFGYLDGRQQFTVEFADGTPGRVFDPDDIVEVHFIVPGTDLPPNSP